MHVCIETGLPACSDYMYVYLYLTAGLTVEDIRDVLDLTWEYRANWKFIGTELNIKQGDIEAIASNHHKVEDCLHEMLCCWLRRVTPRPTRSAVYKALRSERVAQNIGMAADPVIISNFGFLP